MKRLLLILLLPLAVAAQPFTASDIAFIGRPPLVTDWALRVVANGGAMPSQNTIIAMENLRLGCIAADLTNKIYSLCVFVPDSVIASATPLFLHKGYTMWTNNFVSGDLSINGLKGDGSTKFMDTGCMAKSLASGGVSDTSDGSRALTVIVTESGTNATEVQIGYRQGDDAAEIILGVSTTGADLWLPGPANASVQLTTNDFARVGYVSANVWNDANTNISLYVASPLESHKVLMTKVLATGAGFPAVQDNGTIKVFAFGHTTTNLQYTAQRMSLAMSHDGFTAAESSSFWTLALACRQALGGGTGDPVHDWNNYIVNAGGSAISSTTSNAARTLRLGMDTRSILYKIVSANIYPPDGLIGCRTPFIWKAGPRYYTNFNFGETNVSINGLTGNTTTKSLGLGLRILDLNYGGFSDTSGGITILTHTSPTTASSRHELGTLGTGANSIFALENFGGNMSFYAWTFVNVNTDFVRIPTPAPGTNWVGFLSGNRTAANAIRLDYATNSTYTVATNATGSTASNNNTLTNTFSHAVYISTSLGPTAWSDRTISYTAVHAGLTSTESSNHWELVKAYRQAIGGGYP